MQPSYPKLQFQCNFKKGKTRTLDFYQFSKIKELGLVDAPGYGYAKGDKRELLKWGKMMGIYISIVKSLQTTLVLIDAEHGFKEIDSMLFEMLGQKINEFIVVFTKADKVKNLDSLKEEASKIIARYPKCNSYMHVTSAKNGTGILELRAHLAYRSFNTLIMAEKKVEYNPFKPNIE